MASFIASQNNRHYVTPESVYGHVGSATAANRLPVVKLKVKEQNEKIERKDKTGSRTYLGLPNKVRRDVSYELTAYLSNWPSGQQDPPCGALLAAAFGSAPKRVSGLTISQTTAGGKGLTFSGAHGLAVGDAISVGGEMRFVTATADTASVQINAPFTLTPGAGTAVGSTVSYRPATELGSVSLFDRWSPATAVQRVIRGAAVDKLGVEINGDFHKLTFAGPAAEWIDSASFTADQGGLAAFPAEPALVANQATPVPGHLGQVWLGTDQSRFYTVTAGTVELDNNIEMRNREFGVDSRTGLSAGTRGVRMSLSLYASTADEAVALYQAARQRTPVSVMLQLGQQAGQMLAIYLPSVSLETPEFDDAEARLGWSFVKCRAQGTLDDEIFCAAG